MYFKTQISDVHIHVKSPTEVINTMGLSYELDFQKIALMSMAFIKQMKSNNILLAAAKVAMPQKCYSFAGFHYPEEGFESGDEMVRQAKEFCRIGFDGIKMLDGKPNFRQTIGEPLDSNEYDKVFAYLEEVGMPVLYHINDPFEFWNWELMPEWAKAHGRDSGVYYGEGRAPSKEQIEHEILNLLSRHKNLKIIIPHFFFLSNKYDMAVEVMETYPNLLFDLAPGWEMFEGFAGDYDKWRNFFIKYSNRIIFGTDVYSGHWRETIFNMRNALESDKDFEAFEENCKGLNLDEETLKNIYQNNFDRFLPNPPKKVNMEALREYIEWVKDDIDKLSTKELIDQNNQSLQENVAFLEEVYHFHILTK